MASVQVRYFASLRAAAGISVQTLETDAPTLTDLYGEVKTKYGFRLAESQVKVALNGDWSGWDAHLSDGDKVVFMPPVAGG
jgi:MoaD family protein